MKKKIKKNDNNLGLWIVICFAIYLLFSIIPDIKINTNNNDSRHDSKYFRIISSTSTSMMDEDIIKYGKKNKIKVTIDHYGDLEIVDILNSDSTNYDAVWISNSLWLYMLDNSYLTTDSKSIVVDPVVMGITKTKAQELNLINQDVYNKDLLNLIRDGKLKYIMASVTKTNTGATSYLSFLNSLAGSPEVLTESMLDNDSLKKDLKDLFKGVERVSGDEEYLSEMFKNGKYDAMINYESSLIKINQELVSNGKEPLYLIYPIDGVAINDMPFAYINNDSNNTKKKEEFQKIQSFLRSDESIRLMESYGYRSWYGGTNPNASKQIFNPEWGIDTNKYLKDMKYPSKSVITKAINLYIEVLRKPTHVVFCLDVSGSMYGDGLNELKEAMSYILDNEKTQKDKLQFSKNDKITIITFDHTIENIFDTTSGDKSGNLISSINDLEALGGTNIYSPTIEALKILEKDSEDDYTKTVILMTDGMSNGGSYKELSNYYKGNNLKIPIYSITFGSSDEIQLKDLASLSNGKVFDGKSGLLKAFSEVRSYN